MAPHFFSVISLGYTFARNNFNDLQAYKRNEQKKMSITNTPVFKSFFPILLVFISVSSSSVVFSRALKQWGIDQSMLIIGNIILFIATVVSFFLHRKAMVAGNTQVFLRNVYSGMLFRFFLCLIASFIYIYKEGNAVNVPGLFALLFLYMVYTFMEIAILLKYTKQNRNA